MKKTPLDQLIRPELRRMSVYGVEDADGLVKLDAMENPYAWPAEMRQAWLESLSAAQINRYPDPSCSRLKQRLRETFDIPEDRALICGNGSDELIQLIITALARPGARVLTVTPGFVMYRRCAIVAGMGCEEIPLLDDSFALDRKSILEAMESSPPSVVFVAYPNNPTGNLFNDADIEAIIDAAPCPVVVDEAYEPFAGRSWAQHGGAENLLVMRTLSKLGLAGLRLGFMLGSAAWIDQFEKIRLPYNVNVLSQQTAEFALARYPVLRGQTDAIRRQRDLLWRSLEDHPQVRVWRSDANFLLFRPAVDAGRVFHGLKERGVLIKNLHGAAPMLDNCLRVTVGTPEENQAFLAALDAALADA